MSSLPSVIKLIFLLAIKMFPQKKKYRALQETEWGVGIKMALIFLLQFGVLVFCLFFPFWGGGGGEEGISLQLWFKVSSDTYMYLFIH